MMIRYLLTAMLVGSTGTAFAASGGSPNGKPFVEINGQIAEVQGQIATLEQRLDNLLTRVALNESRLDGIDAGIALLQAENETIAGWLLDLEAGQISIEELLMNLEAEIEAMRVELGHLGDVTGELEAKISLNQLTIDSLSIAVDSGFTALEELITQNGSMISLLREIQDGFQDQLSLKQNILNSTCDDGFEFRGFEDGNHVCVQIAEKTDPLELFQVTLTRELAIGWYGSSFEAKVTDYYNRSYWFDYYNGGFAGGANRADNLRVSCPSDSSIVGGGPRSLHPFFVEVDYSYGHSTRGWQIGVKPAAKNRFSPLWKSYIRGGGERLLAYGDRSTDPDSTLAVSVFALCARASSNEPIE